MFKVVKQYLKGGEIPCQLFDDLTEARLFIQDEIANEARMNVTVIFRIYDGFDMLEEFSSRDATLGGSGGGSSQSRQSGSKVSFNPTPLSTTPRPPGSPANWLKEEDEDE